MWDRYDPRDDDRDRGSAWDRGLGGRGTSDRDRNEERDPRDVFCVELSRQFLHLSPLVDVA